MKQETKSNEAIVEEFGKLFYCYDRTIHAGGSRIDDMENFLTQTLQAKDQALAEREAEVREEVKKRLFEIAEKNAWLYDEEYEDMVLYLNDIPPIIEMALSTNTPKV